MTYRKRILTLSLLALSGPAAQAATVWQLGAPGRAWPNDGVGGGPDVDYIQEAPTTNAAPGSATSPLIAQQNDSDYYFAGVYPGSIGVVASDELGFERAFAGANNTLRIHNNLAAVNPTDLVSVSFEANNLDANGSDSRYGIEVYVNGNLLMSEMVIRLADLNTVITTPAVSAASLGITPGSGFDNIVELRGINYSADNGGGWMGIDYTTLDASPVPEPSMSGLLVLSLAGLGFLRRRK